MTKTEAIQTAYCSHWDLVKSRVNENGWCNGFFNIRDINYKENQMNYQSGALSWRPLILKGIEDNNGWNKLITMDDLPTKPGMYIARFITGEIKEVKLANLTPSILQNWMLTFTHWREIVQLPQPLY